MEQDTGFGSLCNSINMKNFIKNSILFGIVICFSVVIFYVFLKDVSMKIYCHRKVNFQRYNYRQTVVKNGVPEDVDHDTTVAAETNLLYEECLKSEY